MYIFDNKKYIYCLKIYIIEFCEGLFEYFKLDSLAH